MRDFQTPGRSEVYATEGMCATSHPLAAKVAIDILQSGGNAVDAAIAGAVLLGFCEPQMTGIGGDMFALVQEKPGAGVYAINGSGRAAGAVSADAMRAAGHETVPVYSTDAVTIPGAVDGFCALHTQSGKLDLAQILAPAIHYAENGVPIAPRVAFDLASSTNLQGVARDFYQNNGAAFGEGDLFRAPGQAEVLRKIANQGRDGFYAGDVAQDMVDSLQALGGCHDLDDFAATRADFDTPIQTQYRDVDLIEHPPNGQGATALLLANIMDEFDIASLDPFGPERLHLEAEATKQAYHFRDQWITDRNIGDTAARFCDPALAAHLASQIDPKQAQTIPDLTQGTPHRDTVYITVVDRDRMAVSLIYSIFHGFGSGLASNKYGILFQNRGAGFNLIPGHVNEIAPGKRPMHTIIPGMLGKEGRMKMPFGVMGGQYQPTGHVRFLSNMVDFGMTAQEAIDAPRSFAEMGVLKLESGIPAKTAQTLADWGHKIEHLNAPLGGAQAILIRTDGVLKGASDPRKDGCAIGY